MNPANTISNLFQKDQTVRRNGQSERRDMPTMRKLTFFALLAIGLLLGGCGGDGSTVISGETPGTAGSGVVVDPYITGATVDEVNANGTVVQSATTNAAGAFTFGQAVGTGSTLRLRSGSLGQHAGTPYAVVLKRDVAAGATAPLVVSPLTTLLADGATPAEVVQTLTGAGITGMSQASLYNDPMAGLSDLTTVTNDQLRLLQASMTVGSYLEATATSGPTTNALPAGFNSEALNALAAAIQDILNATTFQQVATALESDPEVTTLTLGDFIQAAVIEHQPIVNQVKSDLAASGTVDMTALNNAMQTVQANMTMAAKSQHQQRMGQTPPSGVSGEAVFTNNCDSCHSLTGGGTMDLSGKGNLIEAKITGGHRGLSLTAEELSALAGYLDGTTPTPPPTPQPADGQTVYDNNCAGCHAVNGYDASGSPDLAAKGSLVDAKLAPGHMGQNLTAAEVTAIAGFLDQYGQPTPPPNPQPADGQTVYDNNCAGCHAVNGYDASGAPDLAAKGSLVDAKLAPGHMGQNLTAAEVTAIAGFLDQYQAPASGPDYSDCTACHAQPPNGTSFPNEDGAHTVHQALPGVGTNCAVCHEGASHNGQVDLAFPPSFDAQSGGATDNLNGTCSNISCHGGQTTPDWWAGSIDVNSQCNSCHTRGTSQYNSQNSGEHSKHRNYSCTVCHNTAKMGNHFGDLATPGFETDPATTVGGGSTRVGSYDGNSCSSVQCHGGERW